MTAWNSFSTASPLGITSEVITYTAAGGHQVHAYVSRPTGGASAGGIVAVILANIVAIFLMRIIGKNLEG